MHRILHRAAYLSLIHKHYPCQVVPEWLSMSGVSGGGKWCTYTDQLLMETCLGVLIQTEATQTALKIMRVLFKCSIWIEVKGTSRGKQSFTLSIEWTLLSFLSF